MPSAISDKTRAPQIRNPDRITAKTCISVSPFICLLIMLPPHVTAALSIEPAGLLPVFDIEIQGHAESGYGYDPDPADYGQNFE
jgi:hypothetical protein